MSLSANDQNSGAYNRLPSSGKTPPPAPSAAYAKRAREMQADERMGGRYRPPALRALASGGSPPGGDAPPAPAPPVITSTLGQPTGPSQYPAGFRRARAGTLPSNIGLAAQRFTSPTNGLGTTQPSAESLLDQLTQNSLGPARPNLRHSSSIASSVASSAVREPNSRLRSESLTLPSAGLANNPFGPSIFSSSWLPSSNGGNRDFHIMDELRSDGEDYDHHTLDYLGLDDGYHRAPPPAATISELRNQAQAAIAGNLAGNPSRLRASTVSNPYRTRPGIPGNMLSPPVGGEEEEYDSYNEPSYIRQRMNSFGPTLDPGYNSGYDQNGYKSNDHLGIPQSNRPRAISVGTLEDPMRQMQRRNTVAEANMYINDISHQSSGLQVLQNNGNSILAKAEALAAGRNPGGYGGYGGSEQQQHAPQSRAAQYLLAPGATNRSVSPKAEQSSQTQTPTRSLWIGNLDAAVSSEQLIHVFAPYGAIESLRLLPEKECGFVNFVDQADAIRAKEDVLNRLGGNIGMPNGQMVRIGFGKADSAPVAPAKGAPTSDSPGPGTDSPITRSASAGGTGMDAQLQSSPTRALWIGSIPSTTTPATILSVFSPYGPIESARVLTHKNCGFINFERLDDAVRARKALNGRDVLGSDVGAIRIGFAKVPVKGAPEGASPEEIANLPVQGVGEMTVSQTIAALRGVKGASTIPPDQQVLGGAVENYRSNLLLHLIASGAHNVLLESLAQQTGLPITEQQMVMQAVSNGNPEADTEIKALADFRPPSTYYTTIPLVSERTHNRRWDASKLRELRKKLDSTNLTTEEVDQVAGDFLDGEIVDLASDWLGNTVVQKLFEKCSAGPRFAMLERLAPSLAMIGIHKNGTWAAQKIIECVQTPEEVALIAQNLRAYVPPLLLDQFGNYVVQCCLRFGGPANEFIFDAIVDRMWEVAQGRFGARSMRACLESNSITINQQRRVATAIILNSIPLATNPNGALLLTWLLDTSNFPSRYNLLAPRFTPHLSHLCTHKLASLTVLRIVNQKIEPDASKQVIDALFCSPGDHVLTDVLGDQVNGVAVIHKILTSSFIEPVDRPVCIEATKRVLIELKVIATQAYRRLIEEVGLPVPNFQPSYTPNPPPAAKPRAQPQNSYSVPGLPSGYPSNDQGLASMMASLQMGGQNPQAGPHNMRIDSTFSAPPQARRTPSGYMPSPTAEPFNPRQQQDMNPRASMRRTASGGPQSPPYPPQSPAGGMPSPHQMQQSYPGMPPQLYQQYMYQGYPQQQNPPNMGTY